MSKLHLNQSSTWFKCSVQNIINTVNNSCTFGLCIFNQI